MMEKASYDLNSVYGYFEPCSIVKYGAVNNVHYTLNSVQSDISLVNAVHGLDGVLVGSIPQFLCMGGSPHLPPRGAGERFGDCPTAVQAYGQQGWLAQLRRRYAEGATGYSLNSANVMGAGFFSGSIPQFFRTQELAQLRSFWG
jgi:hypothetical protein